MPKAQKLRKLAAGATAAAAMVVPLATLPADAAGRTPSAISLSTAASVAYGTQLNLLGVLGKAGSSTRIGGARVILQRANPGVKNWTSVTSAVTSAQGRYDFKVSVGRKFDYRVIYPGSARYTSAVSPTRSPQVTQRVVLHRMVNDTDEFPYGGDGMTADVTVYPGAKGRPAYLQRYDGKTFRNIGFTRTSTTGRFKINATVAGSTAYYRIYAPAFGGYGAGYSTVRRHTSYSSRGAFKRPLVATGGGVFEAFPASQAPYRNLAKAYTARGGTVWADINVAGCNFVTFYVSGVDGTGGQTKIEALVDGRAVVTTTVSGAGWVPDALPFDARVLGRQTMRFRVSDVNTTTGPRALIRASATCSY